MKKTLICLLIGLAFCASLHRALAQNTLFSYQGQISVSGTPFTGTGGVQFALVTSTNYNHTATATATPPSGGFITIINVTLGGSGYVAAPAISFAGGGGSGLTATATINGSGSVNGINVNNPGSGYTSTPTVIIAPPPPDITYSTYWSNDGTSVNGSEPAAAVAIEVTNGLFTVMVGNTNLPGMDAISAALFNQPGLELRIWFNDGPHGFAVLNPAQNLTPTPYAVYAANAGAVAASNIVGTLPAAQLPSSPIFTGTVLLATNGPSSSGLVYTYGLPPPLDPFAFFPGPFLFGYGGGALGTMAPMAIALSWDDQGDVRVNQDLIIGGDVDANGTFYGNGSGLSSVPAASLTGSIADRLLSANVALRTGGNAFNGTQTITNGYLGIGLSNPTYPLEVASNGVPRMTMDYAGNLECSGTVYSHGVALTSDRNVKENFATLDNQAVLAKVAALPLSEWNYKTDSKSVQHIGPMAQDFHAAFGLDGADDKHISVVDEGGVALAAIQGLNQKLEETRVESKAKDAEIAALKRKNEAFAAQLQELATAVKVLAGKK